MAQYVKATNFASKDALLSGDPNKIVKGAEVDDEYNNIQTAVNSKADTLSPTLTGTPLAPTATAGTNTTQVATTAFVGTAVTNGVTTERTATATLTNKTLTDALANTQAFGDSSTKIANTAFPAPFLEEITGKASLRSVLQVKILDWSVNQYYEKIKSRWGDLAQIFFWKSITSNCLFIVGMRML